MIVAIIVPMTFMLVTGLVLALFIQTRAKEKQLLIERGLTPEQMMEFYAKKEKPNNSTIWLKIGILSIALGLGIGVGNLLEEWFRMEELIALAIFVFLGAGFIAAFFVARKYDNQPEVK